jgi:O-antigen ligase
MSMSAAASPIVSVWRWLQNPAFWMPAADLFAVLTALSLPWSTSLVAIFAACWLGAAAMIIDPGVYLRSLKNPICALPLALFALAAVGTLWSDATWSARLYAVGPALKLLLLPGLFYHFERSSRGMWVFVAFLVSCALLMVMSWLVLLEPGLSLKRGDAERGIFVKNYIDQSQEFTLCAVALAYPIITFFREKKIWLALLLCAIVLGLLTNMAFVIVSRTAIVTMPVMLAIFALLHLRWRTSAAIFSAIIALGVMAWALSPQLQMTTERFTRDYRVYKELDQPTSIGLRLEFWSKSLRFFAEAPVAGHGTGSTRGLFEHAATGPAVLV